MPLSFKPIYLPYSHAVQALVSDLAEGYANWPEPAAFSGRAFASVGFWSIGGI